MSLIEVPEPWTSAQATQRIRAIACGEFTLSYTEHALDQLADRDLLIGDLNYLLRNGFVYVTAHEAPQKPYWKYQIECTTPNSENRNVRAVVIPDWKRRRIKVVTVMWADEPMTRGR